MPNMNSNIEDWGNMTRQIPFRVTGNWEYLPHIIIAEETLGVVFNLAFLLVAGHGMN